jgi:hypothetical protein
MEWAGCRRPRGVRIRKLKFAAGENSDIVMNGEGTSAEEKR